MTTPFECIKCNYKTKSAFNFKRHINSSKHKKKICAPIDGTKKYVCECGKKYKYHTGLAKHKHKCKFVFEEKLQITTTEKDKEIQLLKAELADLKLQQEQDKSVILEAVNTMAKNHSELTEATKKIAENGGTGNNYTDCYNQKMTINVFLNEECKNAMNLTDFVDQFKVSLEDLQYTRDNGFAQGITNIFTKQLKDMDPTTRPIHCSDSKRLQFYVKDENEWVKDSDGKQLDSTINKIKIKQANSLTEWELEHPDFIKDPKLTDEWCSMMAKIAPESKNDIPKIKRSFAKYFEIKEAMKKTKN
tara:strand:- start:4111 stop:5019 length:909 start_codon:yes stop_codon:yes gene_type:complete